MSLGCMNMSCVRNDVPIFLSKDVEFVFITIVSCLFQRGLIIGELVLKGSIITLKGFWQLL